jgi:hypothetical protein
MSFAGLTGRSEEVEKQATGSPNAIRIRAFSFLLFCHSIMALNAYPAHDLCRTLENYENHKKQETDLQFPKDGV